MIAHGASDEAIQKQTDHILELQKAYERGGDAAVDAQDRGRAATQRHTEAIEEQSAATQQLTRMREQMNELSTTDILFGAGKKGDKVTLLSGEEVSAEEARRRHDLGSSREVMNVPGAELLGGKTVDYYARLISKSGIPLMPGQTL